MGQKKEINRLKKINFTIEKNWCSQNFDFLSSKNLSPGQFWGAPTYADINEF